MKVLTPLLLPFSLIYRIATGIRNRLYDSGARPSVQFDVPVISVGNLALGGTGKTPMIEYLVRLLDTKFTLATLSRGYGRKTKGFRIAGEGEDAQTLGDEPMQFYRKFKGRVVVAVGEERAFAIPLMLDAHPDIDLILLDDAFQHRRVRPAFQILLTDFGNPFVHDYVLPAGRLRESRTGARRADVVVVTKCPAHAPDEQLMAIQSAIRQYSDKPVFFSRIRYRDILPACAASPYAPTKIVIATGIANPTPMMQYLESKFEVVRHFEYADHHPYSERDVRNICSAAAATGAAVVTTEKDVMRMDKSIFQSFSIPLYYLPIELEFLKNGKEFDEMVLNSARSYAL